MSVHYKFKSALEYDTVTFDGLHISVKDLKNAILQQKRIGKSTDFDLQVTNAQTKEVYEDEITLIPKNTSLLIARIPILTPKTKPWEGYGGDNTPPPKIDEGPIAKTADLSSLDASEDDKIKAMMSQSTQDYDPSNYMKIRGANQMGMVPPNYRCHKCHQGGHWIKDCTFGQGSDPIEIKKSTGIPRNFLVPVDGPQVPGAMMTPNGMYAVPLLDLQAYNQKVTSAPIIEQKTEIPEDLLCSICSDLLADAVMIPCCGNSFCDECIRSVLLESEDHECPDCHEKDISPDTLIPNRFLRTSVANFRNTTGYVKKSIYREKHEIQKPKKIETVPAKESTPPAEQDRESTEKPNPDEKTIISEADSTEQSKIAAKDDGKKAAELETNTEGPPGVSPKTSPKENEEHKEKRAKERERTKERSSKEREFREHKDVRRNSRNRYRGDSPRKNLRRMRSSSPISRGEERSATPTVDEPTTGNGMFNPPVNYGNSASMPPLMPHMNPMPGGPPPFPSNHPPPISSYPPSQGPPPNYRMPPPGTAPYLPPGSYPPIPPRALYDTSRPPMGGLPPNFNPSFPPRVHREFRRLRERTPPGVIDDPLAAFNRMLREKDERKRRAKRRSSYSRSRSRSPRSFSRSPVRRRSRSPRMSRRSRSRSRSFSLSRSRSRSFSGSPRGTPYRSPARRSSPPPRRGPTRYKSPLPPVRSPPPRSRHERHRSRDYDDDRDYLYKERARIRERRSRERDRYYDSFDDRRGVGRPQPQPQWASQQRAPMPDSFYPQEIPPGYPPNRFTSGLPRDFVLPPPPFNQPLPQTIHNIQRQFQDIHPPGVDDDIAPPGVDEPQAQPAVPKSSPKREEKQPPKRSSEKEKKRHDRDRTPEKKVISPKRRSKSNTPDRHAKKKRRESSDREERIKRDESDNDKGKKSKEKKKHKEKKETERKKKKEKKDKHKKESKEKKSKEEFKQVIPKNVEDDFVLEEPQKIPEVTTPIKEKDVRKEEPPVIAKTRTDEDRPPRKPKEEKSHKTKDEEKPKKPKEAEKHKIEDAPGEDPGREPIPAKKSKRTQSPAKKPKREQSPIKKPKREPSPMKKPKREASPVKKSKERKLEPEEPPVVVQRSPERKPESLYEDILEEGVDTGVMEEYGKIEKEINKTTTTTTTPEPVIKEIEEEEDEEEKDVLELHSNDIDLKGLDKTSDILAPMPEKSKWEVEEDVPTSPKDTYKSDSKSDKSGKVTNEVLKRAENAIFAKAINAIRPIEIKKLSTDRAKLYSGEREVEKTHNKLQITVSSAVTDFPSETSTTRLPVKERLGIKVEDPEKVISLVKKRDRTISPFSRRGEGGRNHDPADRKKEESRSGRHEKGRRSRSKQRDSSKDRHRGRAEARRRSRNKRSEERKDRNRNKSKDKTSSASNKRDDSHANDDRNRKKRTKSRAESEEPKHKKHRDKKPKKEKPKKKEETPKEPGKPPDEPLPKPSVVTKRKPTIDESNFEPDYDLESHSDEENSKKKAKKHSEDEKSSSSESASSSSSEEERKKKKRKKHRKKRKKESSSSNTSESESESSDSDKGKKRKKHRKNKKKKKRSKHK